MERIADVCSVLIERKSVQYANDAHPSPAQAQVLSSKHFHTIRKLEKSRPTMRGDWQSLFDGATSRATKNELQTTKKTALAWFHQRQRDADRTTKGLALNKQRSIHTCKWRSLSVAERRPDDIVAFIHKQKLTIQLTTAISL